MRRRRGLWAVFAVAVGVVAGAMSWITGDLVALERGQQQARADAAHQEALRLALWRMDSWLGPTIAAEAEAPVPATRLFRAAYAVGRDGSLTSVRPGDSESERIARAVDVASALGRITEVERRVTELVCAVNDVRTPVEPNVKEYASRAKAGMNAQNGANFANQAANPAQRWASAGPLVASWVVTPGRDPELVFVRRALTLTIAWSSIGEPRTEDRGDVMVFVADWPAIDRGLVEQVSDVLPAARLRPILGPAKDVERGFVLASVPAALVAPRPAAEPLPAMSPTRITLVVAWAALAFGFVAVGVSLKRTLDLSERRSRFASSVTHELRTPLTTFRLYSEMLADGMVSEPAQRQTYLDTLKSESSRLATLVENVLAYARVEEGRLPVARRRIAVADLLREVTPPLERRAAEAGMTLRVESADAAACAANVDPAVVGQILFNLVDNACKYSSISPGREIEIGTRRLAQAMALTVRDHGPGIPAESVRAAFTPFERAGRPAGDTIPGIGLGLALSRALARDLGGDLDYEPAQGGGACFVLTLPSS